MEHFRGQIFAYGDDRSLIPISVTSSGSMGMMGMGGNGIPSWARPATPPPAGFDEKELADRLPSYTVVAASDTPCCICIDELEVKQVATKLKCGHIFHHTCIKQWLTRAKTCPLCKAVIAL